MMPRWSVVGIMSIASLADIFLPRDPILRFSGTMCHSQYPEGRTSRYERNVVWKSPQINSSVSFWTESIKFMVFCNPKDAAIRFSLKSFAKAASCLFVIEKSHQETRPWPRGQRRYSWSQALLCLKHNILIGNPGHGTAVHRLDSVLNFLIPCSIDLRVGGRIFSFEEESGQC
jgi:hypothetical protein